MLVFRQLGADTDAFTKKFGLFKKTFSDIGKDFRNKRGLSSLFNVVTQSDIDSLKRFNTELKNGSNFSTAYKNNMQKSGAVVQRQAVDIARLRYQQKILGNQLRANKITQEQYNTKMSETNTAITNIVNKTKTATAAQKALNLATKAGSIILNTAMSIGISLAINAIVTSVVSLANGVNGAAEKVAELNDKLNQLQSELDGVSDSLTTTQDRIREIQNIGTLNIFEQDELDKLKEENEELLRKYNILKNTIALEKQSTNKSTKNALQENFTAGGTTRMSDIENFIPIWNVIRGAITSVENIVDFATGGTLETQRGQIDRFAELSKILEEKNNQLKTYDIESNEYKALENEIKGYQNEFDNLSITIKNISSSWGDFVDGLDPEDPESKKWLEWLQEGLDKINGVFDVKNETANEIWEDPKYASVIDSLKELVEGDKLDITSFLKIDGIEGFIEEFKGLGYTVDEVIEGIKDKLSGETSGNNIVASTITALGTLRETFDDTLGGQSTIQSAFDKIIAGTSLTNDEVLKLIDICPELSGAFTKTADGWTTDVDNIISANESVVKSMRETIEEQIKLREASSRKSKDNIDSLTIARNKVPTEGVAHFTAQIEAENLAISENEKEISTLNTLLDMLGLSLSEDSIILTEIKANIEELGKSTNTLITEAKSVSEVFAEQSENGELSAESVMKIVESGYAAALMYDKETGAIKLNAEAYQMLAEAKIAEQKVTIESDKAEAIVKRAELEAKAIGYLGASYIMTAGAADAYNQVREEMSDVDEQIAGYDAYMSLLDNLMSKFADITNGTYGATGSSTDKIKEAFDKAKKELDHLLKMNLITQKDYYARLDALNEQYYANSEKHSDEYQSNLEEIYSGINELQKKYLDEQIDAINEKADAEDKALSLKEKELEVEEKLAALNRAKKDKIRIFNGHSGVFDWGVDAEKLASAQSEYDKAVADLKDYKADEQRSEIITLIEEIRDNIGIEGSNPLSSGYTPISTEDLIKRFGGNYKGDLSSILSNVSSKTTTPNINGLAGTIANGVVTNNSSNSSNNVSIVLNGVDLSNSTEVKNAVYEALIDVFADPKVK
jgi:hypothetical protein